MNAFSRTTRSLATESWLPWAFGMALGVLLLAVWSVWFLFGTVPVYEVSEDARLETTAAVHPISAVVDGRIVSTRLAVGREVRRGEILAELDALPERSAIEESRVRRSSLVNRVSALRAALEMEREALAAHEAAVSIAAEAARAEVREAEAQARLAESEVNRLDRILAAGAVAEIEFDRVRANAEARRASAEALALVAERADAEGRVAANDRRARIAEIGHDMAEAQGELMIETERAHQLEHRSELRRIRAPIDGRIGESANLTIGAVVRAGETLGSIVPDGTLRTVAEFPTASLGRVRTGQRARIRLEGFPWPAYSRLHGSVSSVAREPRDGRLRVEILMDDTRASTTLAEHGLPGEAEIEVERASPLALVLRAAGGTLSGIHGDRTMIGGTAP